MIAHPLPHIAKATMYSKSVGVVSKSLRYLLSVLQSFVRMAKNCAQAKLPRQLWRVSWALQKLAKVLPSTERIEEFLDQVLQKVNVLRPVVKKKRMLVFPSSVVLVEDVERCTICCAKGKSFGALGSS